MKVGVLGPLQVGLNGTSVTIAGARLRSLLSRLAVEPGRRVSISELASAVWGAELPADPGNALQSLVSRLRRVFDDPGLISQHPAGYQLHIMPQDLDAGLFTQLVAEGRALLRQGDLSAASARLREGLDLWRGPALIDIADADYATALVARWEELRLGATSDLIGIAIRQGRSAEVVGELEELVSAYPLREGFILQLMTALAASGRTAEALDLFQRTRHFLAEALGTDPGPELKELHLALLRGQAALPSAPPSARGRRTNLRTGLTSFVGRSAELERVSALMASGRLTTIVGPGGAGKTRLATEAAQLWLGGSGDPAWLVELAPVTSEANIAPTFLSSLGIRDGLLVDRLERLQLSDEDRLFDALADSHCLLVVDNCEHLIEQVAKLVNEILGRAPGVRILATSREPLSLTGEALCSIPPLSLPPAGSSAAEAALAPAVKLWVHRAQAVSPGFALTEATAGLVTDIVRRLDGLPLAIELAAARLRVLPLAEIAVRLSDRFRLLTGGNRASLPRHRTLRAVVEWSWDLLSPAERLLAERLAVFPAGAGVDSATAVCADDNLPPDAIEDLLISLVDKSLLQHAQTMPVRYRMLETIREYGAERLTERHEIHAARIAHADHFAQLAARLEPSLHDATQLTALAILDTERDNIVAALRYYGDSGRPADALRLGLALVWYWSLRGSNSECGAWMSFVIDVNDHRDDPLLIYAEAARAMARASSGDVRDDWSGLQAECLDILSRLGERVEEPPFASLQMLGPIVAFFGGTRDLAGPALEMALKSPDRWVRAAIHSWSANVGENDGDPERIRRETELALAEFAEIGDRWGLFTVLTARAHLATLEGDLDAAIADYQTALRYVTELGSTEDDFYLLLRLAGLHLRQGDTRAARASLTLLQERSAGLPMALERGLFAESLKAVIEWREGQLSEARELIDQLRARVTEQNQSSPLQGHTLTVILSTAAIITAGAGDCETALADVISAYPVALGTSDMPIIATVGVAVAHVAESLGQLEVAAEVLGASAEVRGGEDLSDPTIGELIERLTGHLGKGFQIAYGRGQGLSRGEAIERLAPALLTPRPADSRPGRKPGVTGGSLA